MPSQVYVGFSEEASAWYAGLPGEHRHLVDRRLRKLALDPERSPVRALSPGGRTIYVALATTESRDLWAYRIDFVRLRTSAASTSRSIAYRGQGHGKSLPGAKPHADVSSPDPSVRSAAPSRPRPDRDLSR
jgi:hypothetical protein